MDRPRRPRLQSHEAARLLAAEGRRGGRSAPRRRAVHHAGRRPRLAVRPSGLVDGPLPAHYEPQESPFENRLYEVQKNPVRERYPNRFNRYQDGDSRFPYVMTTYRLTEHHTAGGMSRNVPVLSELQPEMFIEVSPELARERGLEQGGWATVISERAKIEARVMITERVPALEVEGRRLLQVGLPYHWGSHGIVTGDSANDLFPIVLDPNVHIQEVKAATCDVQPGRLRRR
jgi:formate dehydrogenase major subunit